MFLDSNNIFFCHETFQNVVQCLDSGLTRCPFLGFQASMESKPMLDNGDSKLEDFVGDIDVLSSCDGGSTEANNSPAFDLDSVFSESESESVVLVADSEHSSEEVSKKRKAEPDNMLLPTSKKMPRPKDSSCGGEGFVTAQGQGFLIEFECLLKLENPSLAHATFKALK